MQIWDKDDPGKWKLGADKGSGGLWNNSAGAPGKDPLVLADKPFGEWNKFRILQVGERVTVWLNDKLVVDHARLENYFEQDRRNPLAANRPDPAADARRRDPLAQPLRPRDRRRGGQQHPALQVESRFRSVFNGKDFTGWAGPVENYEVKDGAIVCKPGKGGTIYTDGGVRRLRGPARVQAAARRQQRPGDPLSRQGRHGLRRHVRAAGARRHASEVRQARPAAVPRLGLRHGGGAPRLSAARRRMELPGSDRQRLDASRSN